eukprot:2723973-Lingulodinium_polyedra.AAC.1
MSVRGARLQAAMRAAAGGLGWRPPEASVRSWRATAPPSPRSSSKHTVGLGVPAVMHLRPLLA